MVCSQVGSGPHVVSMVIREILPGDAEDIRAFNSRLEKAGVTFSFPVDSSGFMLPRGGVEAPYQTGYVLSDGSAVRGGYILKHERAFAAGESFPIGNYQLPLSEGIIDRRYAMVGVQLIKDALARQPRLYCLGMGSTARPLPRLLSKLAWSVSNVPFLFRIEKAGNFTREIRFLRQRSGLPILLDLARNTGLLAAILAFTQLRRRLFSPAPPADVDIVETSDLPDEIDELFSNVLGDYGLMCDRRAAAMRNRLPVSDPKLSRWVLRRSGKLSGWAVVSVSQLADHTQFGNMKVGCLVDGLAAPSDLGLLIGETCRRLEAAGCDLLVSNQTHPLWIEGLRRQGFFAGPSNFVLALSPPLTASHASASLAHFNRGDGDGPINL
jgi:hypothetical protein